jgi:hypothetical protein
MSVHGRNAILACSRVAHGARAVLSISVLRRDSDSQDRGEPGIGQIAPAIRIPDPEPHLHKE